MDGESHRIEATSIDEIRSPDSVVVLFETMRDWSGHYDRNVNWGATSPALREERTKKFCDFQPKWTYSHDLGDAATLAGGRHFRGGGSADTDPWGYENVALVDGHVRSGLPMETPVSSSKM